ncbi:hypothetical protein PYW08_015585 [Mythimna loreyi]|uniref:Uncharacterized protein n=1 Tax=Mythimna loreyi TaxID=667449 RepID=A0ACC2QYR5_9NEOP|nr:hypothetical protein PYW08_015585 [Mythimna loreyi]
MHERLAFIKKMIDVSTDVKWQEMPFNIELHQNIWLAFDSVVKAMRLTEKMFRIYILLIVLHLFVYHLLGASKLISTIEAEHFRWSQFMVPPDPQSFRFLIRISLICFLVNLLENLLCQTKESCIKALEKIENVTSRSYLKNIVRVISTVEPMSVYHMFAINSLAIELIAFTLKYVIVLLQFRFSSS